MDNRLLLAEGWRLFNAQQWEQALSCFNALTDPVSKGLVAFNISQCLQHISLPFLYPSDPVFYANAKVPCTPLATIPVYAGMATVPSRLPLLERVLPAILPQVDRLFLFLNNFDEIPLCVKDPKITLFTSQQYGDLRDNGKFFALTQCDPNSYFFTVDDDIAYPANYVATLIQKIEQYHRQAVVGAHGAIYPQYPRSFFQRFNVHFARRLLCDMPVSVLGTGTLAAYTARLTVSLAAFCQTGMADLQVAAQLKQQAVPLVAIARPEHWLTDLPVSQP